MSRAETAAKPTAAAAKPKIQANPARRAFARTLAEMRKHRGYESAYAFFHKNGGEDYFSFSYHHYLLIEKGMRLPSQASLKLILNIIGAAFLDEGERARLLTLYVRALVGGDPIFDAVFEGGAQGKPEPEHPVPQSTDTEMLKAMARGRVAGVPRMTHKQMEAATSSPAAFWIYQWLYQTGQKRTIEQLCDDIRHTRAEVEAAVAALLDEKMIEERKDGVYASPHFDTGLFAPASMDKKRMLWFAEQISKRVAETPESLYYSRYIMAVQSKETISTFCRLLRESMDKVFLFRPAKPVHKGDLVSIEARICPILPIGPRE